MQRVIQKWVLKGRTITEDDFSCLKGIVRGDEYLVVSELEKCGFRKTENNSHTYDFRTFTLFYSNIIVQYPCFMIIVLIS